MGIFGALSTSVAGMRANSYALENISGNIANSQTTAFKRIDSSFSDLIPEAGNNAQLAGSVTSGSRSTNTSQGAVSSAAVSTYMAINGEGFFAVQRAAGYSDNVPQFEGTDLYTRRGDFTLDKNGYLVNQAGYYLMGIPVDPTTGNPKGSVPEVLRFQNDFLPAQVTTKIDYRVNLASYPLTQKANSATTGSELLNPSSYVSNPRIPGTPAQPYVDTSRTGIAQNTKQATVPPSPITAATALSGAAGSDSIANNFVAGNTITITAGTPAADTVLTFVVGPPVAPNDISVDGTIGDLLARINALTGSSPASTVTSGSVVLHTGITSDLKVASNNTNALASLGFNTPVNLVRNGGGTPGAGVVIGSDKTSFLEESISGAAVTAYDPSGAPVDLQIRWAKVDSSALGTGHADVWNMFYQTNTAATGNEVAWQNAGTDFTFGPNGQLNPVVPQIVLNNPTINGKHMSDITIAFGAGGLTQFADPNGNVKVNRLEQDGYAAGQLKSVSVSNEGRVVGSYTNGRNIDLAEVSIATFNGADFLKRIDGGAFEATNESGAALYGRGGSISGSALEASNADIADEFTKLIVTQQAYSANTKVITTANSMVQDLLNVMR